MTPAKGYTEMKDSGIDWIGGIPKNWKCSHIKRAFDVTLGKMLQQDKAGEGDTLESYLCAANIKWSGVDTSVQKQMWFSSVEKEQYLLKSGDLLIMEGGLAGTACSYNGEYDPCYIQNSVLRCRGKSGNLERFLYYWINAVYCKGYIDSICNKATIQHYTKEKVMDSPIFLPPLEEQQSIVFYLDTQCAKIDEIIAQAKASIEDYKQWKASIIYEAVTKGLDPNVEMKESRVEWIGKIPVHWTVSRVKNIVTNLDYLREPISAENRENKIGLYDYYGASGVIDKIDDYNVDDTVLLIGEDGANLKMRNLPLVYRASGKFWVNNHAHILKVKSGYSYGYVAYLLEAGDYNVYITGSAQPKLSQFNLMRFPIVIPDFKEQVRIEKYLDKWCSQIDSLIAEKEDFLEDLEFYKKSLIYEVVTGKRRVQQ